MCQPLCKLLGYELSYLASDVKLKTSHVASDAKNTIGLFFASDRSPATEDAAKELKDLSDSLLELHQELKKRSGSASFEVVLIPVKEVSCSEESSSKVSASLERSFSEKDSPFLCVSYEKASTIQEHLVRKYEIQETPCLVLLNAYTAEVILYNANRNVLEDPKGLSFPWKYPALKELFSPVSLRRSATGVSDPNNKIYTKDGKENLKQTEADQVSFDSIHAPVRALLFAAFWCPPCKPFLTALTELYTKVNKCENRLEIIFVSSDRSQESFHRFYSLMPWLAIPFENEKLRELLTKMFNVKAIPNLTLLDENGKIITTEGRLEVNDDLEGIEFPWYKQLVEELRDRHSTVLNNSLCMIYFTDDTEIDYENGESMLTPIAVEIENSNVPDACETKCFVAADSDLAESLRIFMDLDETRTYLVVTDISNSRYAAKELIHGNKKVTSHAREFLHQFQQNKLVYKYIQSRFV